LFQPEIIEPTPFALQLSCRNEFPFSSFKPLIALHLFFFSFLFGLMALSDEFDIYSLALSSGEEDLIKVFGELLFGDGFNHFSFFSLSVEVVLVVIKFVTISAGLLR
jgi:hypothetical protein